MVSDGRADAEQGERPVVPVARDGIEAGAPGHGEALQPILLGRSNDQTTSNDLESPSPAFGNPTRAEPRLRKEESDKSKRNAIRGGSTPFLRLDTGPATIESSRRANGNRRGSPLGHSSNPSPASNTQEAFPQQSPVSARTRERGFSLRRAMLSRNIHGEPESSAAAFELDSLGLGQHRAGPTRGNPTAGPPKKSNTTITISPVVPTFEYDKLPPRPLKTSTGRSSLPHYETWLKTRVTRSSLYSSVRSSYKKAHAAILRIQELPPTKDGRHIPVDIDRRKGLIDERTNREYVDNTVRSCKYTAWNFLPRQLYAQFSKLANFYFLCVSILQMIPGLSTTGTYTTIIPLAFFVALSMAKEGYDDIRRFKLDRAENNKETLVLRSQDPLGETPGWSTGSLPGTSSSKQWKTIKWKDLRVGDVVKLVRNEAAPADLMVLHAKGLNDVAYIETMALDGETNLKSKQASPSVAKTCSTVDGISKCNTQVIVEDPNLDLYNFEGKIGTGSEQLPLTNSEIIYRGSIVRNTREVMALAIYTGEECKIRMNATKNPRIKAPSLQAVVNKVVIITVLFVLALAVFNTVAYQIWRESTEEKSWYLVDASVGFFPILASFIILFNTMIPLSLYVSLEIVKLFQMILMNDLEMYDAESNTPMEARTSTINEELGQVKYVTSSSREDCTKISTVIFSLIRLGL